jgi:hypothetical protein
VPDAADCDGIEEYKQHNNGVCILQGPRKRRQTVLWDEEMPAADTHELVSAPGRPPAPLLLPAMRL